MVAIVRLEGYEILVYMRHFSEKATGRRTGGNSNPNSYQVQREKPIFFRFAQQGFLSPDWHIFPPWVLKVTQGQLFATQGQTKVVYLFCFTRNLARSSTLWFMVNHEFTGNWIYGKMVLPGVTGGKNTSSVTPFSVPFSAVPFS